MTRAAAGSVPALMLLAFLAAPAPARAEDPVPQEPAKTSWWRKIWPAAETAPTPEATSAPAVPAAPGTAPAAAAVPEAALPTEMPTPLAKSLKRLRTSPLAKDPKAQAWLDYLGSGKATPADLNATAIFLTERGMANEAEVFAQEACDLLPEEPDVWVNLGTIRQKRGDAGGASSAYGKALALDPNHALAHYNMGVLHDAADEYDAAIEEYRIALTLDPNLADPRRNPQIVNNDKLLPVSVLLYQQRAGSMGLPLVPLAGGPKVPATRVAPLPPEVLRPSASKETTLPVAPSPKK